MQLILLFITLTYKLLLHVNAVEVNGDDGFEFVLSYQNPDGTGDVDVGQDEFNDIFHASENHILLRWCTTCGSQHDFIYYKRLTNTDSVNLYYLTSDWMTNDDAGNTNNLGTDFELYSTLADALAGTNRWTYCNYDDAGVGMFRDCGVSGYVPGEWTSRVRGGDKAKFYVYAPELSDPCLDVTCDDGDLCTSDFCDPVSGECTFDDISALCIDTDACTIDTCDALAGCVNTAKDCNDGNICNGEEACVDGECVSPDDYECPPNFLCNVEAQECLRDCSLFAIDGYLTDCSAEFDDQENQLFALEEGLGGLSVTVSGIDGRVTENSDGIAVNAGDIVALDGRTSDLEANVATNAADIATNTADIATNTPNIASNAGNIATNSGNIGINAGDIATNKGDIANNVGDIGVNAGDISTNVGGIASNLGSIEINSAGIATNLGDIYGLDTRLTALEERVYAFAPLSDRGEGNGNNQLNSPNETGRQSTGPMFDFSSVAHKDDLIVLLIAINVMLLVSLVVMGVCYCKGEKRAIYIGGTKYAPVNAYSSADEHAHLNDNKE